MGFVNPIEAFRRTSGIQKLYLVLWIRGFGLFSALGMGLIRILYCFTTLLPTRPKFCHHLNPQTTRGQVHNIVGHTAFVYVVCNALHWFYLWKAIKLNSRLHWKCYLFTRVLLDIWGATLWVVLSGFEPEDDQTPLSFYLHLLVTPLTVVVLGITEILVVRHCYQQLDSPIILKLRTICRRLSRNRSGFCFQINKEVKSESPAPIEHLNFSDVSVHEKYLISPLDISIHQSQPLGGGNFGMVFQGTFRLPEKKTKVAVKILHGVDESTNFDMSVNEIKTFLYAGEHPNLVKFFGVSSDASNPRCLYVILELCPLGSMCSYLRKRSEDFDNWMESYRQYVNVQPIVKTSDLSSIRPLNTSDLMRFSYQVVTGMEHLAAKNIVHGDLAARNVLVGHGHIAKITDFGLSRKLYNYDIYVKGNQGMALPWKWLSIEALEDLKFSEKSDVWSFAVLLWEIFTLGGVPFDGVSWSLEFFKNLREGMRLPQPEYCPNDIYELMKNCWEPEAENRPSFVELKTYFSSQIKKIRADFTTTAFISDIPTWRENYIRETGQIHDSRM